MIKGGIMELNKLGEIVKECWFDLEKHYHPIGLDEYCIIPNHFHGSVT